VTVFKVVTGIYGESWYQTRDKGLIGGVLPYYLLIIITVCTTFRVQLEIFLPTYFTDWRLLIPPTSLNQLPTFGRTEITPSNSAAGLLSTTSFYSYPQVISPNCKLIKKILALEYIDMS